MEEITKTFNSSLQPLAKQVKKMAETLSPNTRQSTEQINKVISEIKDEKKLTEQLNNLIASMDNSINNVADLYELVKKKEQLLKLEKMAKKKVDNIIEAIEKSKKRPLPRIIYGLGIRHVGKETAEILAKHFKSIDYDNADSLANASREKLMEIETIGPKIADSIIAFFRQEENRDIIKRLEKTGVRLEEAAAEPKALPLAGTEFVLTGTLVAFSRQEAEARIKALGGTTGNSVTKKTTYLVVGADPGSKLAKAQNLDTKTLNEEEFLDLLKETT